MSFSRSGTPKISRKTIMIIIAVIVIGGSVLGAYFWFKSQNSYGQGAIVILKDDDFTKEFELSGNKFNLPGSGTEADPYRIENLVIDSNLTYCIWIAETTKYFVIENCTLSAYVCIFIDSVEADTCQITDNTFTINSDDNSAITIDESPGIYIADNTILSKNRDNSGYGITLFESARSIIKNNYCFNFSIGIHCWSIMPDVIIEDNLCVQCVTGILIDGQDWRYLDEYRIVTIEDLTIENNTCLTNKYGIVLYANVVDSSVNLNNCSNNLISGIVITDCSDILVTNNFLKDNGEGLTIVVSSLLDITNNAFQENIGYAINATDCITLEIYSNNFVDNNLAGLPTGTAQAYDNNSPGNPDGPNYWYDVTENEGNYWNDLTWTLSAYYEMDGEVNRDDRPLEFPVLL